MGDFAAVAVALYVAHHVGDYWVQTDHQALHKGKKGAEGRIACLLHCMNYVTTQIVFLVILSLATDWTSNPWKVMAGLAVSGVTHYVADRREFGLMFKIARRLPGKSDFLKLGAPRESQTLEMWGPCPTCEGRGTSYDESTGGKCWDCRAGGMLPSHVVLTDNPSLATGAWALDQSWHIFWGVFVAALIIAA